jgi:RIO-like serine/threonine protein kinase
VPVSPEEQKFTFRLTPLAQKLLMEAAADSDGTVLHLQTFGGLQIQANDKELIEDQSPRTEAKWESALNELCRFGLLQDRGHKREVFKVTGRGYDVADWLRRAESR